MHHTVNIEIACSIYDIRIVAKNIAMHQVHRCIVAGLIAELLFLQVSSTSCSDVFEFLLCFSRAYSEFQSLQSLSSSSISYTWFLHV